MGGQISPPKKNENWESTFVGKGWYYGPFCLFLFVYDGHSKLRIKSLGVLEKNDGRLNFQDPLWKSTKLAKMKISLNFAKLPSSALALAWAGLCWFYSKLIRPATNTPTQPATQNSTFWSELDLTVKSKVVSLDVLTLELPSDLNPVSHRGYLTLFQPPSHLNKNFQMWHKPPKQSFYSH